MHSSFPCFFLAVQYYDRQQSCFTDHVENLSQILKSVSHEKIRIGKKKSVMMYLRVKGILFVKCEGTGKEEK